MGASLLCLMLSAQVSALFAVTAARYNTYVVYLIVYAYTKHVCIPKHNAYAYVSTICKRMCDTYNMYYVYIHTLSLTGPMC